MSTARAIVPASKARKNAWRPSFRSADTIARLIAPLFRGRPGVAEFLRALSGVDLGRIQVAFAVDREIVDPVKFAGVAAVATEAADDFAALANQRAHFVIGAVGVEQEALRPVDPESQIPHRAVRQRFLGHQEFLHETTVFVKHLDAVSYTHLTLPT